MQDLSAISSAAHHTHGHHAKKAGSQDGSFASMLAGPSTAVQANTTSAEAAKLSQSAKTATAGAANAVSGGLGNVLGLLQGMV